MFVQDLILKALKDLNIKQNEEHFDQDVKLKYRKQIFQYVKQHQPLCENASLIADTEINRLISLNYRMYIIKNFRSQFSLLDSYRYIYYYLQGTDDMERQQKCAQLQNYLSKRTWKRRVQEAKKILEKSISQQASSTEIKQEQEMNCELIEPKVNSELFPEIGDNSTYFSENSGVKLEDNSENSTLIFSPIMEFSWDNADFDNNINLEFLNNDDQIMETFDNSIQIPQQQQPQQQQQQQLKQQIYNMDIEEFLDNIKHSKREKLEYETKVEALQYLIENDIKEINIDNLIKLIEKKFYKDYSNKKQSYIRSQLYKFFNLEECDENSKNIEEKCKKRRQLIDKQIIIYHRQQNEIDIDIYFN